MNPMNPMNADTIKLELLRETILACVAAASPNAVTLAIVRLHCRMTGFGGIAETVLLSELDYLLDKGLVANPDKVISPGNRLWKITATGRDVAESKGLA